MPRASAAAAFCQPCPVRRRPVFKPFTETELAFVQGMWRPRRSFAPDADILRPDEKGSALCTLWEGWAYRYKALPGTTSDGRTRCQILDILPPGDPIGLESTLTGSSAHGVRALSSVQVCVHDPGAFDAMFTACPGLCRAIMAIGQMDMRRLDHRLALLGQASAPQRLGFTVLDLYDRLRRREMVAVSDRGAVSLPWPLKRRHLADLLGLSCTHVTRSFAELREAGLVERQGDTLLIKDRERLVALSEYVPVDEVGCRGML